MNSNMFFKVGVCIPCANIDDVDLILFLKRNSSDKYFLVETDTSEISEKDYNDLYHETENRQGEPTQLQARVSNALLPFLIPKLSLHGFQTVRSGIVNTRIIFRKNQNELRYYYSLFLDETASNITPDQIIPLSIKEVGLLKEDNFAYKEDHLAVRFFLRNKSLFLPKQFAVK